MSENMTYEQRQAEIVRIEKEHWGELNHPLISEGNIDPDAISAMSDRKKKQWQKGADVKMGLLARITALSATDEKLAAVALGKLRRRWIDQRDCAAGHIERVHGLGRMSHRKNGKGLKPSWQRSVDYEQTKLDEAVAELAKLLPLKPGELVPDYNGSCFLDA